MLHDEASKVLSGLNSPKGGSPLAAATVAETDDQEEAESKGTDEVLGGLALKRPAATDADA